MPDKDNRSMTHSKTDVSVILVNYNTRQMTSECIDSIISHTKDIRYEIILVDNHSTDGSQEFFANDNRLTAYIYSEKNGGFGYGNNIGMEHSHGKYIFLLNTDTLLVNNAIKIFFDYAEAHEPGVVYGCWLTGRDGKEIGSYYNFPAFTFREFWRKHITHKDQAVNDYKEKFVDIIYGADLFIPRKVVGKIGGFDCNIFMYGEEGEFQYRMEQAGYKRKLITAPQIIHLEGGSGFKKAHKEINMRGHFVFLKLHMPAWKYFLSRVYYAVIYTLVLARYLNKKWARKSLRNVYSPIKLLPDMERVKLPQE